MIWPVGQFLFTFLLIDVAGSSETLWNGIQDIGRVFLRIGDYLSLISLLLTYTSGVMKSKNKFIPVLSKIIEQKEH